MKQLIRASFVLLVLLAIAQPVLAAGPANSGHLILKRSPTLGRNYSITIRIDGKLGGLLSWRRTFETHLAPGRHTITAEGSEFGTPFHMTLDVKAGQTYSYTAHYNSHRLTLD